MMNLLLTGHPSVGKTTIIVNTIKRLQSEFEQSRKCTNTSTHLHIHGFYTEECRNSKGDRIGFDIVHWDWQSNSNGSDNSVTSISTGNSSSNFNSNTVAKLKCVPLSRSVEKVKKSDPHVGKYKVNIENVAQVAIPTIQPIYQNQNVHDIDIPKSNNTDTTCNTEILELIMIDEIGKMEMLCPDFLPAVKKSMDSTRTQMKRNLKSNMNVNISTMVLGTIPTPRYGRVIPAVEEIRARDDVIVVHVTKDNRNELGEQIFESIKNHVGGGATSTSMASATPTTSSDTGANNGNSYSRDMNQILAPFLYTRPIGASSMNDKTRKQQVKDCRTDSNINADTNTNNNTNEAISISIPCGPLFLDTNEIKPKVLFLGETASAQPTNLELAYCERSMFKIFSRIFEIEYIYSPNSNSYDDATSMEQFKKLRAKVLTNGICIWDVLCNIHMKKKRTRSENKRQRKPNKAPSTPNDIEMFLTEHPTIDAICFIGKKAQMTYLKLYGDGDNRHGVNSQSRNVEMIVLPSSSSANSRMTNEEKALAWKESLSKFFTDL